MIVGGYQISNALIAALLVASTAGAGVATDSFSGVADGLDIPLSGPQENATQNNTRNPGADRSDNQTSPEEVSDNEDQNTDSQSGTDSDGSQDESQDGAQNDSDADNGTVVDDINETDETSDNDTNVGDNLNETTGEDNETSDSTETDDNQTVQDPETDSSISIFEPSNGIAVESQFSLLVSLEASNASYEVVLNGEEQLSGDLEGSDTLDQTLQTSKTDNTLEVIIQSSGEIINSKSVSFTLNSSSDTENKTGIFVEEENITAGKVSTVRLYQDGETVSGEVFVDEESIGQTDGSGSGVDFEVPNTRQITISTSLDLDGVTKTVQGYEENNLDISFSFQNDVIQTEQNTLSVQNSSNPLTSQEVFVNGVSEGNTNSSGEVSFTVPETNTINTSVSIDGETYWSEFTAQEPLIDYSVFNPKGDNDVEEYQTDFTFDIDSQESGNALIYIDGQNESSIDIQSGEQSITETLYITEGSHEWYIETNLDSGETVKSNTYNFQNSEPLPEVDVNLHDPSDGSTFNDYGAEVSFETNTSLDYEFEALVNGMIFASYPIKGAYLNTTEYMNGLEPGTHDWKVRVIDEAGRVTESSIRTIETTAEPPIADINLRHPEDGGPSRSAGEDLFQYNVDVFEDAEVRLFIGGQEYASDSLQVQDGWLYETGKFDKEINLDSGTYDWYVEVESSSSGEVIQSEVRTTNQ